jgi:hypothetical protein
MAGYRSRYDDPSGLEVAQGLMGLTNMFVQGQKQAQQMADEQGINQAYEQIAQKMGSSADVSVLDNDPVLNTRHGVQAYGRFMTDRAKSEQGRLQMFQNMSKADDAFYKDFFRPLAFQVQEAFQKGDMRTFGALAQQLSEKSPLPFRVTPNSEGTFDVFFRSDKAAEDNFASGNNGSAWVSTNRKLTPQQVMQEITGIMSGEQQVLSGIDGKVRPVNPNFLAGAARHKMGTILGNAEKMASPDKWIPMVGKNGQKVSGVIQNPHADYSAEPSIMIVGENGGQPMVFGSIGEAMQAGFRVAPKKGKGEGGEGFGPKGNRAFHEEMLEAGYAYDKGQGSYFRTIPKEDSQGNIQYVIDLSQHAPKEVYNAARERSAARQGKSGGRQSSAGRYKDADRTLHPNAPAVSKPAVAGPQAPASQPAASAAVPQKPAAQGIASPFNAFTDTYDEHGNQIRSGLGRLKDSVDEQLRFYEDMRR